MTAAVTALAVGVTVGALWAGLGPAPADPVSEVRLEATSSAGPNPFMTPVGEDRTDVAAPAAAAGTFSGDTPGLFGEAADRPSCTRQAMIDNLAADTTKSAAWGRALGVESGDITTYGNSLNPVVLRSDTAVTEHGYADGTYTAYPAVLQAGTAVLVNSFGEPTVKCFSGNPLTRPADFAQAGYVGRTWRGFAPTRITYVRPTQVVVRQYIYVDIDRGDPRPHRGWCWDHPDSKFCTRPNPDRWCEKHPDSKRCSDGEHGREDEPGKPGDGNPGKPGDGNPGKPGDGDPGKPDDGDPGKPDDGDPSQGNPPAEGNPPRPDDNTLPGGGAKEPDGSVITPPSSPCPGGPGCQVVEKHTTTVSTRSPVKAKPPKENSGPTGGAAEGGPAGGAGKGGGAAGGGRTAGAGGGTGEADGAADAAGSAGSAGESSRGEDKAGDGE